MATPVGRHVGVSSESVGDSVIDLLFVALLFLGQQCGLLQNQQHSDSRTYAVGIRFRDTLGDNLGVTLFVTSVSTVLTLVSFSGKEELLTQGTHDGLVELPLDKFVAVHLVDIALSLSDGSLST